jgi:hypothetical protein
MPAAQGGGRPADAVLAPLAAGRAGPAQGVAA